MSETREVELKNCPFCGGKPNFNAIEDRFSCTECGAETGIVLYRGYNFEERFMKAIAAWNRRADSSSDELYIAWKLGLEKGRDMSRAVGQWTTKLPSVAGYYWYLQEGGGRENIDLVDVHINVMNDGQPHIYHHNGMELVVDFVERYGSVQWLKADIPALPESEVSE